MDDQPRERERVRMTREHRLARKSKTPSSTVFWGDAHVGAIRWVALERQRSPRIPRALVGANLVFALARQRSFKIPRETQRLEP